MIRAFGDPSHPTTFQLSRIDWGKGTAPAFALASADIRPTAENIVIAAISETHPEPVFMHGMVLRVTDAAPPVLYVSGAGSLADLLQADIDADRPTTVTFTIGKRRIGLTLGKMTSPLKALNACMDDLLKTWGYDPEVQATLKSAAKPLSSPATWINSSDYPAALVDGHRGGGVAARIDVSATGKIVGCHIMEAGGDPAFEKLTCDLVRQRGGFLPAIDKSGKAAASYYALRVMWKS